MNEQTSNNNPNCPSCRQRTIKICRVDNSSNISYVCINKKCQLGIEFEKVNNWKQKI